EGEGVHFGLRPGSPAESRMLLEYWDQDKLQLSEHDVELVRDAYDDCIAALDRQVGALLDELERPGLLQDTPVIITSDHGVPFGPRGAVRRAWCVQSRFQPLRARDPCPPADPRAGGARGANGRPAGELARPAGHGGRPAGTRPGLAIPRPLAGRILACGAPGR